MRITLPSGTPAELAVPDAAITPKRGLVVFPDIMGLRPLFDDLCARLAAEQGWAVCAPEPFPGHDDWDAAARMEAMPTLDDEAVLADAAAAADATGVAPVGVIGFCMGGMLTLKASASGRFDRAAAFYGMIRLPEGWGSATMGEPIDYVRRPGRCPTMAVVGTVDPYTPADDVADLEAAGVEVVRFEGADHGFVHDPGRPAHRPDDAADAWRRVIGFLRA